MAGKIGKAPCGHEGEHIIGTYVRCLKGCDAVKRQTFDVQQRPIPSPDPLDFSDLFDDWDNDKTPVYRWCPFCNSRDTEPFQGALWHCKPCGKVFTR
jgi:hypothetical protein